MNLRVALHGLCCAALLTGCASMTDGECRRADWYARGLGDGRSGAPLHQVQSHREACAKAGIQPDDERWRAGWSEGVKTYCSANSGWNTGVVNATYYGACAGLDEATFLRYHRAGQLVYRARQELSQNRAQISKLEDELKKSTKDDDRKRLREDLQRAERDRTRLSAMVVTLELGGPPR